MLSVSEAKPSHESPNKSPDSKIRAKHRGKQYVKFLKTGSSSAPEISGCEPYWLVGEAYLNIFKQRKKRKTILFKRKSSASVRSMGAVTSILRAAEDFLRRAKQSEASGASGPGQEPLWHRLGFPV